MDKYRIQNPSIKSTFPSTYGMGRTCYNQHFGPQFFMNTSTQIEFVPGANNVCTTTTQSSSTSMSIAPIIHQYINIMKPKADTNNSIMSDTTTIRRGYSALDIYMDIKNLEKKSSIDLSNNEMFSELTKSTKQFSHYDLPGATCNTPKTQETGSKMELNSTKQSTKEHTEEDCPSSSTPDWIQLSLQQESKKNQKKNKIPNAERTAKKITNYKNRKEKQRQELAKNIHEDIVTENGTTSTDDEWNETIVFVSTLQKNQIDRLQIVNPTSVSFSTDDFPAMPTTNNAMIKQTSESPKGSHCSLPSFGRQTQISECESDDSFIVFDYDAKSISADSDDSFICFEMEGYDMDVDDKQNDETSSESDSENKVDDFMLPGTRNAVNSDFYKTENKNEWKKKKKVQFNLEPVVHHYEETSVHDWHSDLLHFRRRVKEWTPTFNLILHSTHRAKIYNQRFYVNAD